MAIPGAMTGLEPGMEISIVTTAGLLFSGVIAEVNGAVVVLDGGSVRGLYEDSHIRGPRITVAVDQIVAFWRD